MGLHARCVTEVHYRTTVAEHAAVDAGLPKPKPADLSMREADVLSPVCVTAWGKLVDHLTVQ